MRIVGLDFGTARIGIALSDPMKMLATSFGTALAPKVKNPERPSAQAVLDLLNEYEVERFVVGHPLEMSGKAGLMANAAERFAKALEELSGLPVTLWDERLSTAQVEKNFKQAGYNRKQRAASSDAAAATVILQSFLDTL